MNAYTHPIDRSAIITPPPHSADADFKRWRDSKLTAYQALLNDLIVELRDPSDVSATELNALAQRLRHCNMAIYSTSKDALLDGDALRAFGRQLGLFRLDRDARTDATGIARLQQPQQQDRYISYSNRALNWHTDGYYQRPDRTIEAFLLHCVNDALVGGDNHLIDHEVVYALLHDADPDSIDALSTANVMTVPANCVDGQELRPERSGPVFSQHPSNGHLRMRYTARQRHIQWQATPAVMAAKQRLENLLTTATAYTVSHRLQPGQGLICNNVLHSRDTYQDATDGSHRRLLLRARYFDRAVSPTT